jgi:hypothetical protein
MIVYGVTGKLLSLDEILKKKIRSREMNNAYNILTNFSNFYRSICVSITHHHWTLLGYALIL